VHAAACSWRCNEDCSVNVRVCLLQVSYFDKRRDYLKYKEKMDKEGFDPIDKGKPQEKM
jgi:hypothetical protein